MRARDLGFTRLKFFPAEAAGGLPVLKALAAVFGEVRFCPDGRDHARRPRPSGWRSRRSPASAGAGSCRAAKPLILKR